MRDGGLADKADAAVRRERMLSPGDSVIVGVSGGPDSMALLHYLLSRRRMPEFIHLEIMMQGEQLC